MNQKLNTLRQDAETSLKDLFSAYAEIVRYLLFCSSTLINQL